jgi:NagD protein
MKTAVISDMDGVIYRGKELVPGAKEFVARLIERGTKFLFLTNNSELTAEELLARLTGMGIAGLTEANFITSAMVAADFISSQKQGARCFVVGGTGLKSELARAGLLLTDSSPEYVVVGKTAEFDFSMLRAAVNHIHRGAKFIGANPDAVDPVEDGLEPACGAILAAVERATGIQPYVLGKPNALMMLVARRRLAVHSSETIMIGDRMDTDILGGIEAGMTTCLVLSGVSTRETLAHFPYRPDRVFENVGLIDPELL